MSRRGTLGLGAAACVVCCIGPILGVLGAIAALGLAASILIGVGGLIIAAVVTVSFVFIRHRRRVSCAVASEPVPVELVRTRS